MFALVKSVEVSKSCFLVFVLFIWICYQFVAIIINEHVEDALTRNPYRFANKFSLIGIGRTNLHSKTLEYWFNWFNHKTIQQVGNATFTLLHFDYHSNYDITHDPIHECSPSQLIYYHQLIEQSLESMEHLLHGINTKNISQYVYQYGYINTIIWIYPNHWRNYSQSFVYGLHYHRFRKLIYNMTYYLTSIGNNQYKYTFCSDGLSEDEIEFFETKLSSSKNITPETNEIFDNTKTIRFRIHAISLSELQQLIIDDIQIFKDNKIILDFDLDFFVCHSPSETLKDYFNWNENEMSYILNTYLSNHQYAPSHIHTQHVQYAMLVLLHQLSHNQSIDAFNNQSVFHYKHKMKHDLTKISDVIQHAIEYDIQPLELRNLLYHLYRFHLEIGDSEFVEPINNYIQTHQHLDEYLFTIIDDNKSHHHVLDHHIEHKRIAQNMQTNIDNSQYLQHLSVNEFGKIFQLKQHPNYNLMEEWIQNHRSLINKQETEPIMDEENFMVELLTNLQTDGNIYKLTPSLLSQIVRNVTIYQNYNLSYWTELIINSKSIDNVSIWDVNHTKFIHSLKRQYDVEEIDTEQMTYPESLEILQISGDYLYSDWENILNYHASNSNASWINRYIDDSNSTLHYDDWSDENIQLSTHNLSNIIPWNSLDPIQQHFLQKANHTLLKRFISSLTKHQQKFLDWLIFCYLYGDICQNGHSPIDLLEDKSNQHYVRLKNIDWENINELPAIISSEKHNNMLQFTTGNNNDIHSKYVPSHKIIRNNINIIQDILSKNKLSIMSVGIEMSYGHIPKNMHEWLDCELSISLYNTLQMEATQFVRFSTFEGDEKVPHHACIDELIYLFDGDHLDVDKEESPLILNPEQLQMFNDYR